MGGGHGHPLLEDTKTGRTAVEGLGCPGHGAYKQFGVALGGRSVP